MRNRRVLLISWRIAFALSWAAVLPAQILMESGPSLLSRQGGARLLPQTPLAFRPYLRVNGIYDTGLTPVSVNAVGNIPNVSAAGVEAAVGAYLFRTSQQTQVGLDYKGDFRHYTRETYFDGSDHFLSLNVIHQPSRKVMLTFRESAGTFGRAFGFSNPVASFDTTFSQAPANELFDNRTHYLSSQADVLYIKSVRTSFNLGGDGFLVRRRSGALFGVTGATARADAAYRLTRHVSVALDYRFNHFAFTKSFGASDIHSVGGNLAIRLSRRWETALRAGFARVETQALARVNIDPVVAAIIGQTVGIEAFYKVEYLPSFAARLTRSFQRALLEFRYARDVTPGNGIFLTSRMDSVDASYTFTGLRRWNLGLNAGYSKMTSLTQEFGDYKGYTAGAGLTRNLGKSIHLVVRWDVRQFETSVTDFNRLIHRATLGFAFSPGDVPLALW